MKPPWPKAVPLLTLAVLLAYANCLTKAFVMDDDPWIATTPYLDQPADYIASFKGRPLLAATILAMNNLGRQNPVPQHLLNVFIHLAATLTLYDLVRRSLLLPRFRRRYVGRAERLAFAVALLWAVHPLQVQSVTYVVQRGESLAGLFYLLILYALLRGNSSRRRGRWYALAVGCLVLGFGTKEIMVTAPVAAVLYDRVFLTKSVRRMVRRRWGFYLVFLLTWAGFLAYNLSRAAGQESGIGFGLEEVTPKTYLYTQAGVILYYLRLSVWPRGTSIDYHGWPWTRTFGEAMPEGAVVAAMLVLTGWLLARRPAAGFVAAWFFIVLAPTSSVLPIVDAVFEHRMYLPLASVAVLVVFGGDWVLGRGARNPSPPAPSPKGEEEEDNRLFPSPIRIPPSPFRGGGRGLALAAAAITLGVLTHQRNETYESRASVWAAAVERMPDSVRARTNLSQGFLWKDRPADAAAVVRRALERSPDDTTALENMATAHENMGDFVTAETFYRRLHEAQPKDPKSARMLGKVRLGLGNWADAASAYRTATENDPAAAEGWAGLAAARVEQGMDVREQLRAASNCDPYWPAAILAQARLIVLNEVRRRFPPACRVALVWAKLGVANLDRPSAKDRDTLALCYSASGDFSRAAEQMRQALRASPGPQWAAVLRDRLRAYEAGRGPWPTGR